MIYYYEIYLTYIQYYVNIQMSREIHFKEGSMSNLIVEESLADIAETVGVGTTREEIEKLVKDKN